MKNLLTKQAYNYPFAMIAWAILFGIMTFLLNKVDLTNQLWGIICLIGTGTLVFGSIVKVEPRQRMQLLFFGVQTGVWIDEGYYFLFYLFTLDKEEPQDKENLTLIVTPFQLRCKDKMLNMSYNLKYLEGKSNKDYPTEADEEIAKENFKNQKAQDIRAELIDLLKTLSLQEFQNMTYAELREENPAELILNNSDFQDECFDYGIKIKKFLPFYIPTNATQEDLDLRKEELLKQYHEEMEYSPQEAREMAEIQLGQIKVVKGGAGVLGRFDV